MDIFLAIASFKLVEFKLYIESFKVVYGTENFSRHSIVEYIYMPQSCHWWRENFSYITETLSLGAGGPGYGGYQPYPGNGNLIETDIRDVPHHCYY